MTLAATLYNWLLFAHVLAAMIWVGGTAVSAVLATRILRRGDETEIGRFVGTLRVIGPLIFAPAPLIILSAGIWMVSKSWSFSDGWIKLGISLFAAVFLIGALFQSRAAIAAERAAEAGDAKAARRFLQRWSWGARLILLLLVVATWDMVMKPRL